MTQPSHSLIPTVVLVSFFAFSGGPGVAQAERPDFSGTWTWVEMPGITPDAPLFREGTIVQDAAAITFKSEARSVTYRLDASETKTSLVSARGERRTLVSQVRWVTNALLVTTHNNRGEVQGWEDLATYSLNGLGELVVVTVVAVTSPQPVMKTRVLTYKRK